MVRTTVEQFGLVTMAPLPPRSFAWRAQEREVIGVHLRDEERHGRVHAVVARVAHHDVAGVREGPLQLAGDTGVERGEDEAGTDAGSRGLDGALGDPLGDRRLEPPGRRVRVALPFRALAGGEPGELEPRVPASWLMNCWPTIPVAPSTPTSIRLRIVLAPGPPGSSKTRNPPAAFAASAGSGDPVSACSRSSGADHPHRRRGDSCAFEWPAFEPWCWPASRA